LTWQAAAFDHRNVVRRTDRSAKLLLGGPAGAGLIRMTKADQYRARADQCEKEAAVILDLKIKAQLERVAEYWRDLARLAERQLVER
jgi:hypothetical protein